VHVTRHTNNLLFVLEVLNACERHISYSNEHLIQVQDLSQCQLDDLDLHLKQYKLNFIE
jgi:hypothetical protein